MVHTDHTFKCIPGLIWLLLMVNVFLFAEETQNDWTRVFDVDKTHFHHTGTNPYFKLEPGYYLVLKSRDGEDKVKLVVSVLFETRVIDGVNTRVVEEKEFHNGVLAEISRNFFAIDTITNGVYYFGEEVDIYKEGEIVSHEGIQSGLELSPKLLGASRTAFEFAVTAVRPIQGDRVLE